MEFLNKLLIKLGIKKQETTTATTPGGVNNA